MITLKNIFTRDFRYLFFYQYFLHGSFCFTCSTNTDGTLYVSEEDKNEKEATADSVQQRRQYRRQNRQSSSGYKTFFFCLFCIFSPVLSSAISNPPQPPFNQTFVRVTHTLCLMDVVEAVPSIFTVLLSSLEPVGRTWFLTDGCLMVVFFFPSQTRGLPPQRTRDPTGNSLDQVPGTATSGGNEVVRLHHGGGPEAFLQGQSLS